MTTNYTPEVNALLHEAMEADFRAEKARKLKNFQYLNQYIKKGQILFTGSSLMEHFPEEIFPGEEQYRVMIEKLRREQAENRAELERRYKDQMDYYTL